MLAVFVNPLSQQSLATLKPMVLAWPPSRDWRRVRAVATAPTISDGSSFSSHTSMQATDGDAIISSVVEKKALIETKEDEGVAGRATGRPPPGSGVQRPVAGPLVGSVERPAVLQSTWEREARAANAQLARSRGRATTAAATRSSRAMAKVMAMASAMALAAAAGICPRAALSSPRLATSLSLPAAPALRLLAAARPAQSRRSGRSGRGRVAVVQAKAESGDAGVAATAATAAGMVAVPVVAWSLYTLKSTGCGLPPGPGGVIGAVEGVSYLAVLGIIAWSVASKVRTGSGLPAGPFGLLGAVEGLSYLALLAIVVVFGLQALDYGFIPGPLPGEQCFG